MSYQIHNTHNESLDDAVLIIISNHVLIARSCSPISDHVSIIQSYSQGNESYLVIMKSDSYSSIMNHAHNPSITDSSSVPSPSITVTDSNPFTVTESHSSKKIHITDPYISGFFRRS